MEERVFLDSSVWFAAVISDRGASFAVMNAAAVGLFVVLSSDDVLDETTRNLQKKYPNRVEFFRDRFAAIDPFVVRPRLQTTLTAAVLVHPADTMILAAAMDGEADYLLTLDKKHLLGAKGLSERVGIRIVDPGKYLAHLGATDWR